MVRKRHGFSVIELLVALVGGIILLSLLVAVTARVRAEEGKVLSQVEIDDDQVLFDGQVLSVARAPDPEVTNQMLEIMKHFLMEVQTADAVFVFGAQNSNPDGADIEALVESPRFDTSGGWSYVERIRDPEDVPRSVREAASVMRSNAFLAGGHSENFTVLTMYKDALVGSHTSVYRLSGALVETGETVIVYYINHRRHEDDGTGRMSIETDSCMFYVLEDNLIGVASVPVGATASWYRIDADWSREEQGPTLVSFPDPVIRYGTNVEPVSRFSILLPTWN